MSAIAAHYASASAAADRRYADLAAHYDPSAYFHYSPPSLNTVTAAPNIDAGPYVTAPSGASAYLWDAHGDGPVQSPSYSAPSSSSASANAYHSSAAPAASSGHPSVTASFSYAAHADYAVPSHRSSFHAPSSSSSSSSRAIPSHHSNHIISPSSPPSSAATPNSSGRRGSSYTSGTRSYTSFAAAAAVNATAGTSAGSSSTPRLQNATWDSASLYTIEPADPVAHAPPHSAYTRSTASSPQTTPSSPPIKEEDAEGEFIIEVSVPADPVLSAMPEVPLRATHAPPKMRKMMYSFRLENFAIHDGIRSAATQPGPGGIEVGPLREKPVEIEWQIQLEVPLIPGTEDDESFRYAAAAAQSKQSQSQSGYRATSPAVVSPRKPSMMESTSSHRLGRGRGDYATAGSASPTLSLEYTTGSLDNDAWDGSSTYGSVADNSSGSVTTSTASPTFAPIMTPAQSLGWSLRYQSGEVDLDQQQSTGYHRQATTQPSLSRVSQSQSAYVFGGSGGSAAKSSYQHHQHQHHQEAQQQQQAQYGYDSGGYSRRGTGGGGGGGGTAGRYAEVYASSGSSSGWYRTS